MRLNDASFFSYLIDFVITEKIDEDHGWCIYKPSREKSKEEDKDEESIQSNNTPDQGQHMRK